MSVTEEKGLRRALREGTERQSRALAAALADRAAREGVLDVAYAAYDSPVGPGLLAATERGVVSVGLPNRDPEDFLAELSAGISPRVLEAPARLDEARRELDEYFAGRRREFGLELDWRLVPAGFYAKVLRETAKLPYGMTASYGEMAARAGNPRAYRAAGSALGSNPIPIVVPCHRVLRSGGEIGQYGGGSEMKEWLLRLEGAVE